MCTFQSFGRIGTCVRQGLCVCGLWIKPIDLWQGSCLRLLCTRVILMFFSHSLCPKSVSESSCFSPLLYPSACPCTPTAVCQSAWHNTVCLITPPFILQPLKHHPPPSSMGLNFISPLTYLFIHIMNTHQAEPEGQGPKKALNTHKHRKWPDNILFSKPLNKYAQTVLLALETLC